MIAPIDAKVSFEAEGETITLRLNMRTVALANEQGIDLIYGGFEALNSTQMTGLLLALSAPDHPELSDGQALAIITRATTAFGEALAKLFLLAAGAPDEALEGNPTGREANGSASPPTSSLPGGSKRASRPKSSGMKPRNRIN
jgi:hypothetical protein